MSLLLVRCRKYSENEPTSPVSSQYRMALGCMKQKTLTICQTASERIP